MEQTMQEKQLRQMRLQTLLLAAILILLAATAVFLTGQIRDVGAMIQALDMEEINSAITAMTAAAEDLSNVDVEALNAAIAALSGAAENLTAVDMQVLNQAIASLSGAAENLQGLDIETLNQLVASLETVAANLERTSKAITGIFGR